MAIRNKNQREERRRRVLADERVLNSARESTTSTRGRSKRNPARPYTQDALADRQPRLGDAVPLRPFTLSVLFLLGWAWVIVHGTIYACIAKFGAPAGVNLETFNLRGYATLSSWSSSVMLLLSAVLAVAILKFRRHRSDDYRGRYRMWYYMAALLLVASMNASADLMRLTSMPIRFVTEWAKLEDPATAQASLRFLIAALIGVRLLIEMRASKGSMAALLFSGVAYAVSVMLDHRWIEFGDETMQTTIFGLSRLSGHYLLMMSLVVYIRQVFMVAQGIVTVAPREKRAKPKASAKSSRPKAEKTKAKPQTSKPDPTPSVEDESEEADESDDEYQDLEDGEPATLKMSKAERRRMRKNKRKQRRAA